MPDPAPQEREASEPIRVFLGWDAPILPRVAAWLLAAHPADLGEQVVVVPGRRSGRLLLSHLVALVERGGLEASGRPVERGLGGFVPPRVVTPGTLPELFYRPPAPIANRRARVLAWCAVLEAAPARSWPGAGPGAEVSARFALARDLVRAQDELGEKGLRLADVSERAPGALGAGADAERWQVLGSLEREALGLLARRGLADPTAARLEALRLAWARGGGPPLVLCCLATTRSIERAFVVNFASRVTALVAAPEREAALFDAWGSFDPAGWRKRQVTVPQGSLLIVGRQREQADAVGRLVQASLGDAASIGGHGDERPAVTVGLADPSLAGVIGEALAERGLAFHDALGRPLSSTAPWRLLEAVGRYAGNRKSRGLAALLRHPDLERHLAVPIEAAVATAPPAATRELRDAIEGRDWLTSHDLYTTETALEPITAALPGDAAGAALVAAVDAALMASFGDGAALRPLAEWTDRIHAFLLRVYGDHTLYDDAPGRALGRALARLGEELRAQSDAAAACGGGPEVRLEDAIELLFAEVAGEPLGAESATAAIEVMGWLELPLDDAPRLVVAGLDQGSATAALAGGLLGPALRRSLGLEDADSLHARDLYFLELLAASRDATFVTGRRGAQGEPLAPRRILLAGESADLVATVLAFWGAPGEEDEAASGRIYDEGEDESEARALGRRGAFGPILPLPDVVVPSRLPATAFRDYLACPYRFYLRHVLGLRQVRDLPRELEPGDFGRLLHAVLGRFARSAAARSEDSEAIARTLEELLSEEVALRSGSAPRVTVRLQLEQLRRRLRSFAVWQAQQARGGWTIVPEHTEARIEATLDVDGAPFVVTGRVDRIDRHATEGLRLLDYKSAEQASTPEQAHRGGRRGERRWVDLQLPLYELMLRQGGVDGPLALGFVNLGHRLSADPLALAEWSAADLAGAMATAHEVVRAVRAHRFWPPGEPRSFADGLEGIAGDAFPDRERYLLSSDGAERGSSAGGAAPGGA